MTETTTATAVHHEITVDVPQERAFALFVERFDEIKPHDHTLLDVPITRSVFEAHVGGTVYDLGEDGSRCTWARVLAFEPPERLVISWDIGPQWALETDPARSSEVEVRFVAEGPGRTRVVLEHSHLDRHGAGWESLRDGVAGSNGWPLYLARFAALAPH